ncbi:hypothetical protein PRIPAC_73843 [Pristionchus pacificus]|uniref:Uncharacterized protein n=1 Tax=Pristionchus pacificus TaxID=54126 RepID=A0A2A6C5I7_PRIPA|nr:hypothetical protein PRIPAC_73843 [Pristionchus pacificus]|eukprot:PDM73400.1 hypothetical protein PRIPAC_40756 [Pristionchus pacificus]
MQLRYSSKNLSYEVESLKTEQSKSAKADANLNDTVRSFLYGLSSSLASMIDVSSSSSSSPPTLPPSSFLHSFASRAPKADGRSSVRSAEPEEPALEGYCIAYVMQGAHPCLREGTPTVSRLVYRTQSTRASACVRLVKEVDCDCDLTVLPYAKHIHRFGFFVDDESGRMKTRTRPRNLDNH